MHFLADLLVHLEKLGDAAVHADALALVQIALGETRAYAFGVACPVDSMNNIRVFSVSNATKKSLFKGWTDETKRLKTSVIMSNL